MASGANNRDGVGETGNTTTLQFSRLDIDAALDLTSQRIGKHASLNFGTNFDTALDSQGVLHAAWYDTSSGRLLYATRDADGLWSDRDRRSTRRRRRRDAVDRRRLHRQGRRRLLRPDQHVGEVRELRRHGAGRAATIESDKHVGTNPSLAFDIDGNAYLAYYKRSGGNLRLATLDRDAGTWSAHHRRRRATARTSAAT